MSVFDVLREKLKESESYSCSPQYSKGIDDAIEIVNQVEQEYNNGWISVSKKLPEIETEVEITFIRKHPITKELLYLTARAFYTNGQLTTEDSSYCWNETDNWEYDEEKDAYIIPEGWWESASFAEEFYVVDQKVIAWRPLPKPFREDVLLKKQYSKDCSNCKNYTEPDEVDNGCYMCCKGFENNYEPKQTNADRIRSMTDEELLNLIPCSYGTAGEPEEIMPCIRETGDSDFVSEKECRRCILEWLQKEVKPCTD